MRRQPAGRISTGTKHAYQYLLKEQLVRCCYVPGDPLIVSALSDANSLLPVASDLTNERTISLLTQLSKRKPIGVFH